MQITQDILYSILKTDFKSFVRKVFLEIAGNSDYLDNWHIDLICSEIVDMINGGNNRLIINMPTRYLKSLICSIALPAYLLGLNPKAVIMSVSYNDELSSKLAYDCKKVMESDWYKKLFPGTRLAKNRFSVMDFETIQGGGRYATSVNGTITGRGADWIIIDDPLKPADANSELQRTKTNDWYGHTLSSRLNDKNNGKMILVMQRLHEDDLTGYLLQQEKCQFKHIKLQGIAEQDEIWHIKRPFGQDKTVTRNIGDALHPARENIEKLHELKSEMGTMAFAGQYQQDPMPLEGGIIKAEWLHFYNKVAFLESIKNGDEEIAHIIQSWDTAYGTSKKNDYSACITAIKTKNGFYYILDVHRVKFEFPMLVQEIVRLEKLAKERYKHSVKVLIESKGPGPSLIQTLKRNYHMSVQGFNPEYDKEVRLVSESHKLENGTCLFPDDKPRWWIDFEKEILTFPNGKHDDQCDALSQLLGTKISGGLNVRRL